jgi:hypothetical protein
VRKTAALARFRIAVHALYRLRARPVTAVPTELTLWNRGWPLWRPAANNVLLQYLLEQVMHLASRRASPAMSARSRKPDTESFGIEFGSVWRLRGSRRRFAFLDNILWTANGRCRIGWRDLPNDQKSNNIRTAASFCLMVGLDPGKSSIQSAT